MKIYGNQNCGPGNLYDAAGAYADITAGVNTNQTWQFDGYYFICSCDPPTDTVDSVLWEGEGQISFLRLDPPVTGTNYTIRTDSSDPIQFTNTTFDVWHELTFSSGRVPPLTTKVRIQLLHIGYYTDPGSIWFDDVTATPSTIASTQVQASIVGGKQLCWSTLTNASYQAQSSPDGGVTWLNVGNVIPGDGATDCVFDPSGSNATRTYRVLQLQ